MIKHTRIALKTFALGGALSAVALFGPALTVHALPSVTFTTTNLDISATGTGAEILNTGTLVPGAANHVGNGGQTAITLANGLAFGISTAHLVPSSSWNHNASDSGIATITNPAFNQLINSRWWVAYTDSRSDMVIPNLVIGNTYRLQLISVAPASGTVAVEGSPEYTWTANNSVLSATWTAEDATLNMQYSRKQSSSPGGQGGEVSFNGYALHDITVAGSLKTILSFTFPDLGAATITGTNISLTVPYGTAVTNLAPTYTISVNATGTPVSGTSLDFSSSKNYIVTAQDSSTKVYAVTVNVTPISTAKDILTCDFGTLGTAVISGTNVIQSVAPNQAVTNLAPTFTLSSPFASLSPVSGSTNDFTNPVTYTVTAQNGTTKIYSVAVQSYQTWSNSASFYLLTTTNGAYFPALTSETNFPVLVRLKSGNFTFSEARSNGTDLRFTLAAGTALSYQIEEWNPTNGTASVWVKIPVIKGNTNQEIKMYWGKTNAANESIGTNVFNAANGYVSVFHLNEMVQDEVGTLAPVDVGTTLTPGIIGKGRHIVSGAGINGGDSITNYPRNTNAFTSEGWFRNEVAGGHMLYFGRYGAFYNGIYGGCEADLYFGSPPKIWCLMDGGPGCSTAMVPVLGQWYHVAVTYVSAVSRIFVNGQLQGSGSGLMSLNTNIQMNIGGTRGSFNFSGDVDEVRISGVARSTNWLWLEYQNQRPLQTLVGPLVQTGTNFSVSATNVTLLEGTTTNLTAEAGGAQKIYWIYKKNGQETVLAVDQFTLNFAAGRVVGDQSFVLQFKAIYPTGIIKTNDIPVTITEYLNDPGFTLTAPTTWDGRQPITVTPTITNLSVLQDLGVTNFNYTWSVGGVAVIKQITPGVLTLQRSQGSGPMTLTLVMDNGGALITNTATVTVTEPATDVWVVRTPDANEKPVHNQFYARDDKGLGTIYYTGTLSQTGTNVYLNVYTNGPSGDVLYTNLSQTLPGSKAYALSARIAAGLVKYKVVFGYVSGGVSSPLDTVTNLVCGDAYLIDGQSNAAARVSDNPVTNAWIRSYTGSWGYASRSVDLSPWSVGYWGMSLALRLLADNQIPVCIINVGMSGSQISQHLTSPHSDSYGTVAGAKLTHGIRSVLWHQGESDQGWDPTGLACWQTYEQKFLDMSAVWKSDYPNLQHYYLFQIYPNACGSAGDGANDMLREKLRTLPRLYSNMSAMSTVGCPGYDGCHYNAPGYDDLARLICPLVERDNYGLVPTSPSTAPYINKAYFTTTNRNQIALEFGQAMAWKNASTNLFFLDDVAGKVTSGSVSGNMVKLNLSAANSTAQTITYLVGTAWNHVQTNLLYGSNGIAALTFAAVPIAPPPSGSLTNLPATGVTTTSAALNATLACTGAVYNIVAYWNTVNGGTNAALWTNSAYVGSWTDTDSTNISYTATGLTSANPYFFTFRATNTISNVWATNVQSFTTLALSVVISGMTYTGDGTTAIAGTGTAQTFVLKQSPDLLAPTGSWTPVLTNSDGTGVFNFNIPVGAEPSVYFRVFAY